LSRVLCVHGIGQQHKGEDVLLGEWVGALRDGVRRGSGGIGTGELLRDDDVACAFYGDVFRPAGRSLGIGDPWLTAEDATEFEQELLLTWWQAAADADPRVIRPDARTLARSPRSVQAGLRALSKSAFFAGVAERTLLFDLRQVRRYLNEPRTRQAVQDRVAVAVREDTCVLVAHSLGAVVAYEALCAHPEWPVRALVTLGAPLGIRNLIFDRLSPAPSRTTGRSGGPVGQWPGGVEMWTNVADAGDVVALVKDLRPQFGEQVACFLVHNGSHAHDVDSYLTAAETGMAIIAALSKSGGRDDRPSRRQPG
jgi:pimeloyl-ACP methyl ester carboxylesterase